MLKVRLGCSYYSHRVYDRYNIWPSAMGFCEKKYRGSRCFWGAGCSIIHWIEAFWSLGTNIIICKQGKKGCYFCISLVASYIWCRLVVRTMQNMIFEGPIRVIRPWTWISSIRLIAVYYYYVVPLEGGNDHTFAIESRPTFGVEEDCEVIIQRALLRSCGIVEPWNLTQHHKVWAKVKAKVHRQRDDDHILTFFHIQFYGSSSTVQIF